MGDAAYPCSSWHILIMEAFPEQIQCGNNHCVAFHHLHADFLLEKHTCPFLYFLFYWGDIKHHLFNTALVKSW